MSRRFVVAVVAPVSFLACQEYKIEQTEPTQVDPDASATPDIRVSPSTLSFGDVPAIEEDGSTTVHTATVTITNEGDGDLQLGDIAFADPTSPFSWSNLSSVRIAPGDTATLQVTFEPQSSEARTDQLLIESNDPDEPKLDVDVDGAGIAPQLQLSPTAHDFGTLGVGCDEQQVFQVQNTGTADLDVYDVTLTTASTELSLDLDLEGFADFPWTLAPGEVRSFAVEHLPLDEIPDSAFLQVDSNDPYAASAAAAVTANGENVGQNTDIYEQPIKRSVDIVFALDNSGSMFQEIECVHQNFDRFVETLSELDADYQIAVVMDDDGCINGPERYIDNTFDADEARDVLDEMLRPSGTNRNTEKAFTLFESMLQGSTPGGCNEGLIRDDAHLHLIGVSDEPEQSPNPYWHYIETLGAYKTAPYQLVFDGVGGDFPSGCGTAAAYANMYEATVATGGTFLSICSSDWGERLEALAQSAADTTSSFALSQHPVPDTIRVEIDGISSTVGWTYSPTGNSIDFDSDYVPEGGSSVRIEYVLHGECDA